MIVPNNLFEVLGFLLPTSEKKPEYIKGESITDFIGSQRIDTLKRESRYRTYYPKLKSINLLSLNYPSIPLELYRKVGYIKKIICKNIIKTLNSTSPDKRISEYCIKYVNGVLSVYEKTLQLYRLQDTPDSSANIASCILQSREIFCNILDVYQDIQYENMHRNEMNKTIATAYITKKNIPQKVLTVMENTSFKKYFKYVEFDEEVNLNSVKIIEKNLKY